ncbi:hypothetical protein [Clostridium senegalense]|uniref:hypothetical protein n=1 Tax=Clostridium senegalense TaxID=1465809 RepID=UPI000288D889|nr:hypothetical protein [Clostridium senegalense]
MAKFKIELKQHTPLIHFQSEQPGAILRATEVKPKLDRFLIECAFNNEFNEYKQYLIGYKTGKKEYDFKDKKAFDYRLKIYMEHPNKIKKIDINKSMKKLYFASGFEGEKINGVFTNEYIILEFFTFHKVLIDRIKKYIEKFFCFNNFGTRQNKGFGSFYINKDLKSQNNISEEYFDYKIEVFNNKKNSPVLWNDVFREINKLWENIRSVESDTTPYIKEFAKTKGIIWDKDIIRDKFVNNKKKLVENKYLIKDLLGLSVEESWKDRYGKWFNIKKEHISGTSDIKIDRMESPIFFKPLKDEQNNFIVYIKVKDMPKEFWNQKFKITKWIEKKKIGCIQLITPTQEEFNIHEFFEFVKTNENIKYTTKKRNRLSQSALSYKVQNFSKNEFLSSIEAAIDGETKEKLKNIK